MPFLVFDDVVASGNSGSAGFPQEREALFSLIPYSWDKARKPHCSLRGSSKLGSQFNVLLKFTLA